MLISMSFGKKYPYFVAVLSSLILLFAASLSFLDPDFGWHLTTGKIILDSGIPETDPFSYTMPSFPYVDHEWLTDVSIASLFPILGTTGLAILFSAMAVLAIFLGLKNAKLSGSALFVLAASSVTPFMGISPKVISWFLFSFLSFLIFNEKKWRKYWFLLPFLILFWVNVHGSFPVGILSLCVFLVVRTFVQKRFLLKESVVFFGSLAATFINPYGAKIWWIVWITISDPDAKFRIAEWQPIYQSAAGVSFPLIFLLVLTALVVYKYRQYLSKERMILVLIFFIASITAVRHIPLLVMTLLPVVSAGLEIYKKRLKSEVSLKRYGKFCKIVFRVSLVFAFLQILTFAYRGLFFSSEVSFYPAYGVLYLKNNLPEGEIFSDYNWGGYLVWKLPEKKVFINGIMPSWKREKFPSSESGSAMDEYVEILHGDIDYRDVFEKYGIDTVLLPTVSSPGPVERFLSKIYSVLNISGKQDPGTQFIKRLEQDGWKEIYRDNIAIIYNSIQENR